MSNYFRHKPERTYSTKGLKPYGAGDIHCLDGQVDNDFGGNVTEHLLEEGFSFKEKAAAPCDQKFFDFVAPDGRIVAAFVEDV